MMATFFATATDDFFSMGFFFPAAFHRAAVLKHLICFFWRLGSAWIPREWKPERQSAATRLHITKHKAHTHTLTLVCC